MGEKGGGWCLGLPLGWVGSSAQIGTLLCCALFCCTRTASCCTVPPHRCGGVRGMMCAGGFAIARRVHHVGSGSGWVARAVSVPAALPAVCRPSHPTTAGVSDGREQDDGMGHGRRQGRAGQGGAGLQRPQEMLTETRKTETKGQHTTTSVGIQHTHTHTHKRDPSHSQVHAGVVWAVVLGGCVPV